MLQNHHLTARKKEITFLKSVESSPKSEFIAIYGRRRIGKTYLIREYFKNHPFFFEFTGTKDLPTQTQIKSFFREMDRTFKIGSDLPHPPANWNEALNLLQNLIEKKSANKKSAKKIIFFDELPWLASRKSGFLEALDYFWNSFLSKRKDVILIVCGSAAHWMISEIINSKGGLHNRITRGPLAMLPFTLAETREFLQAKAIDLNPETIAEIYMATGGVAYYLEHVQRGQSAAQFINQSFFSETGELRTEFDRLFQSLFDHSETHIHLIKHLANHPSGLSYLEIAEKLKTQTGGTFSKMLTELEKSGFIQFTPPIGKKKKGGIYHLVDEYSLFYLTWVESLGRTFQDNTYWQKQIGKPRYYHWVGHAGRLQLS